MIFHLTTQPALEASHGERVYRVLQNENGSFMAVLCGWTDDDGHHHDPVVLICEGTVVACLQKCEQANLENEGEQQNSNQRIEHAGNHRR